MKILISGASGFIGGHLIPKIIEYDIVALSSSNIKNTYCIDSVGYDFDDLYLLRHGCENVDTVIHLGSFIPKEYSEVDDISSSVSNIVSTKSILMSKLPNLKRFIYISSVDVYGDYDGEINEQTNPKPNSQYGWSKLYCEEMIKSKYKNSEVIYTILRLGHVFGEGEEKFKKVMPNMIKKALRDENIEIYGDGNASRAYIYVDDVVSVICNVLKENISDIYNVVGDCEICLNDLADSIINIIGSKSRIVHLNSCLVNKYAKFDNTKIKKGLLNNYSDFYECLRREIEYIRRLI